MEKCPIDVLLIGGSFIDDNDHIFKQASILVLAESLRYSGFRCKTIHNIFLFNFDEIKHIIDTHTSEETVVLGVSTTFFHFVVHWNDSYSNIYSKLKKLKNLFDYIKEKRPNIKIVFGGYTAKAMPTFFPKYVDMIFLGESDKSLVEYVKLVKNLPNIFRSSDGKCTDNLGYSLSSSESFTPPRFNDDFLSFGDVPSIEITRGCVFNCKFCNFKKIKKSEIFDNTKNFNKLKQELMYYYNNFKIDVFNITDEIFNDSTEKLKNIETVIKELPFSPKFYVYIRPDLFDSNPEQIQLLIKLGVVYVRYGIETLNESVGKLVGKNYTKDKMLKLWDTFEKEWGNNIKLREFYIIGLPGDSESDIREWASWVIKNSPAEIITHPVYIPTPNNIFYKDQSQFTSNGSKFGIEFFDDGWKSKTSNLQESIKLWKEIEKLKNYPPLMQYNNIGNYKKIVLESV